MPKNPLSLPASANLELQHIWLEIENQRGQHLRHFVDQWYCYEHNLVSSYGNADWDLIFDDAQPPPSPPGTSYSTSAQGAHATSAGKKEWWKSPVKCVKEHTIPLRDIMSILLSLKRHWAISTPQSTKLQDIQLALEKLVVFSIISDVEDKLLSGKGLKQSMPAAWNRAIKPTLIQTHPTTWPAFDQFARYRGLIAPWIP